MKKLIVLSFVLFAALAGYSEEPVSGKPPYRVCVLDFSNIDIIGQKRFLDVQNRPIEAPKLESLNSADRLSINRVMQGYIRMIDATDAARTNAANRAAQIENNQRDWAKALDLYNTVTKGEARPILLGGEYLSAYLGKRPDLFRPVDLSAVTAAMGKVAGQPGFPADFQRRLALESGANLLIYGTVSDLTSRERSFQGYGIETKTTVWQLDLILKVVDLDRQEIIYSNVYTGTLSERQRPSASEIDHNRFRTLMDSALKQAAEDLISVAGNGFRAPENAAQ
jgi:hypothetical protein